MDLMLLLSRPGNPPPPWILLLVPVVFLGATWLTNHLMGIDAMYQEWPADPKDPIERNLGWQQVEFGAYRGHCPMSIKFGQHCLHLKQPFPFQPMFWKGPASIPWGEVLLDMGGADQAGTAGLGFAEIDPARLAEVRRQLPSLANRKSLINPRDLADPAKIPR